MELHIRTLGGRLTRHVQPATSFDDLLRELSTCDMTLALADSPRIVHGTTLVKADALVGDTCQPGDTIVLLAKARPPAPRQLTTAPAPTSAEIRSEMRAHLGDAAAAALEEEEEEVPPSPQAISADLEALLRGLGSEQVLGALSVALLGGGEGAAALLGGTGGEQGPGLPEAEAFLRALRRAGRAFARHQRASAGDGFLSSEGEEGGSAPRGLGGGGEYEDDEDGEEEEEGGGFAGGLGGSEESDGDEGNGEEGSSEGEAGYLDEHAGLAGAAPPGRPMWVPDPDPEGLAQLAAMGFPQAAAANALLLARNRLEPALEWLLQYGGDPEAALPLSTAQLYRLYRPRRGGFAVNSALLGDLVAMGYDRARAAEALAIFSNSMGDACEWLMQHPGAGGGVVPAPGQRGGSGGAAARTAGRRQRGHDGMATLISSEDDEGGSESEGEGGSEGEVEGGSAPAPRQHGPRLPVRPARPAQQQGGEDRIPTPVSSEEEWEAEESDS